LIKLKIIITLKKRVTYMASIIISDNSFEKEVLKSENLTLVDFWAEWCGPCKMIGPALEEISEEMKDDVRITKLNIDENPATPQKYNVRGIPTLLLFKNGEVVAEKVGALPKAQLQEWISSNVNSE
jgi:thioredoxin 1